MPPPTRRRHEHAPRGKRRSPDPDLDPDHDLDRDRDPDLDPAGRVGARTYVDLFASWRDVGARGLEVGVGLRDLLDEGTVFVQPYPGGHAPLETKGREAWVRVRYERAGRR